MLQFSYAVIVTLGTYVYASVVTPTIGNGVFLTIALFIAFEIYARIWER